MRAVVVINPISGPGRREILACGAFARDALARHGIQADIAVTGARGDARALAGNARAAGIPLVLAWGGDGTINEVAAALAFSDVCLGIVPGGSGNGLARDLGVPLDPVLAFELAATGRRRRIDAGQIDDAYFFNVAGVGLDAEIARHIAAPNARRGLAGYARLTFAELPFYRARRYRLSQGGGPFSEHQALFIAIANSTQYGNGAHIAPAARLDDGQLDLVVVEAQALWRLVLQMPALFRGTLRPGRGLHMSRIAEAVICGPTPLGYHVDGEPYVGTGELRVRSRPGALCVMVP